MIEHLDGNVDEKPVGGKKIETLVILLFYAYCKTVGLCDTFLVNSGLFFHAWYCLPRLQ